MNPVNALTVFIGCIIFNVGNAFAPPSRPLHLQKHNYAPSRHLQYSPYNLSSKLQVVPLNDIVQLASSAMTSTFHLLTDIGVCMNSPSSEIVLTSFASSSSSVVAASVEESGDSILAALLHNPTLWSIVAMTSIVALLVVWEKSIENIRHNTPKPILPVVDSMLAEVGGLGFIGLFLSTVVTGGVLGQIIESLSETYLGDGELLLETFEFLHTFFFQVGILFFAIAGVVVGAVLKDVQGLQQISDLALDADGDGEVTLDELANALEVESLTVDVDGDGNLSEDEIAEALRNVSTNMNTFRIFFDEIFMDDKERAGEQLLYRERMMAQMNLPQNYAIENYFSEIFGSNLEEIVELTPVTWLPLIPLIALANSVDLSRDVVSASSSNAFDSCGYFYATPWVLYSTLLLQILSLTWSVFNSWKIAGIKKMLLPTLFKENTKSEAILLPPRYEDPFLLVKFNSSPGIFEWFEQFFTGGGSKTNPPKNNHEKLFGATGTKFPSIFRDSIKLDTWLSVTIIVYSTTQIILRDAAALYLGADTGCPDHVVQELVLWSIFVALNIFELSLAPTTFLNYCFVTSVEKFTKENIVKKSILSEGRDADFGNRLHDEIVSLPKL